MRAKVVRAATAFGAVAVLLCGCGGGGGGTDAVVAGHWRGALTIGYEGGGGLSGGIEMDLLQTEDFVSGAARWAAIGEAQGITGPIDGNDLELYLSFRCIERTETGEEHRRTESAVLRGRVDGETLTITAASGKACGLLGLATTVGSASGSLARDRDNLPL